MFAEIPLPGPKAQFLCPPPYPSWGGQLEVSSIAPELVAGLYRGISWMLVGPRTTPLHLGLVDRSSASRQSALGDDGYRRGGGQGKICGEAPVMQGLSCTSSTL